MSEEQKWVYREVDGRTIRQFVSDSPPTDPHKGWKEIIDSMRADLQEQRQRAETAEAQLAEALARNGVLSMRLARLEVKYDEPLFDPSPSAALLLALARAAVRFRVWKRNDSGQFVGLTMSEEVFDMAVDAALADPTLAHILKEKE